MGALGERGVGTEAGEVVLVDLVVFGLRGDGMGGDGEGGGEGGGRGRRLRLFNRD